MINRTNIKVAALCVAIAATSGCRSQMSHGLGKVLPAASPSAIRTLNASSHAVVVEGTMVEKCPVAGCWFKVQDATGIVKVDTKSAGFVVVNVATGTKVRVAGIYKTQPEPGISAAGMSY